MKYRRYRFEGVAPDIFGVKAFKEDDEVRLCFTVDRDCESLSLRLWTKKNGAYTDIPFSPEERTGDVWRLCIGLKSPAENIYYNYVADGAEFTDIYARYTDIPEKWGQIPSERPVRGIIKISGELCENEPVRTASPGLKYRDMIVYRLHVRGFTEHRSSGLQAEDRGRFSGIEKNIAYLKELGINTIELMPFYEFNESFKKGRFEEIPKEKTAVLPAPENDRVNYWGFTGDALRFSVKNAFGGVEGLRSLVNTLHKNGMELICDIYFSGNEDTFYVLSVLRYYAMNIGVDGFHIIGYAPLKEICADPFIKDVKLWADSFPAGTGRNSLASCCNDGFSIDIRRFLKGDEGMLPAFIERTKEGSVPPYSINYVSNVNGFNLRDMVSYDRKHNEANGENGTDGSDSNYSWNCGVEGETGRRKIKDLRLRQMKNALTMLFISQGTPLILSGDEMGHTKGGNNNSYCQDNATEWINWADLKKNSEIFEFVKNMIAFRKSHRIFSTGKVITNTDSKRTGLPDLSYHGESAWRAELEPFRRNIGLLFNGEYAENEEGKPDDLIYVAVNMHWEDHSFSLPEPMYGLRISSKDTKNNAKPIKKWYKIIDTSLNDSFIEPELCENGEAVIKERSISVFIARQGA